MHHNVTIGVSPNGLDTTTWKQKTFVNPYPVEYWLEPIYDLFEY